MNLKYQKFTSASDHSDHFMSKTQRARRSPKAEVNHAPAPAPSIEDGIPASLITEEALIPDAVSQSPSVHYFFFLSNSALYASSIWYFRSFESVSQSSPSAFIYSFMEQCFNYIPIPIASSNYLVQHTVLESSLESLLLLSSLFLSASGWHITLGLQSVSSPTLFSPATFTDSKNCFFDAVVPLVPQTFPQ